MSSRIAILACFLLGTAILLDGSPAAAQQRGRAPYRRYEPPAGPTLTPYLDYFRRPTGVLDRYHQYVVPRRQLNQNLERQQWQITEQDRQLGQLQSRINDLQNSPNRPATRSLGIGPTGIGAGFMNTGGYFSR